MIVAERVDYDGYAIHQRFAYQYYREDCSPLGNVVIFRGGMEVLADAMIDGEDVLNEAFIYSEDALNILWELPLLGDNAFGAVAYQRLFNTAIAEILVAEGAVRGDMVLDGDDIMVREAGQVDAQLKKASVSITHVKDGAALGHTGINIEAGARAPAIAYSTRMSDAVVARVSERIVEQFAEMNRDMFLATAKIKI